MNVSMRHWQDLLHQSWVVFFPPPLFYERRPHMKPQPCSHSRLSSVSLNTDIGHRAWPLALSLSLSLSLAVIEHFSTLPSAADELCYTDRNGGLFLSVSSAVPCCPPSLFSSGVTPFFFLPPPYCPGALSTDSITQAHANFIIGQQPASWAVHKSTLKMSLIRPAEGA